MLKSKPKWNKTTLGFGPYTHGKHTQFLHQNPENFFDYNSLLV